MCQPSKHWKRFYAQVINDNLVKVVATRSDDLLIRLGINFPGNTRNCDAVQVTAKAINEIESYRNCECTNDSKCKLHEGE